MTKIVSRTSGLVIISKMTHLHFLLQMIGIVTFLLLINCFYTLCSPFNMNYLTKRQEKLCGKRLVKALQLLCDGRYYQNEKRMGNYSTYFIHMQYKKNPQRRSWLTNDTVGLDIDHYEKVGKSGSLGNFFFVFSY